MDLNTNWRFRKVTDKDWMQAVVPGTVHTDLYANHVIEDPFYRTNEKTLQWIDKEDWEYSTSFTVTAEIYNRSRIELIFSGLDTHADIYLNSSLLASTDNMFREWILDCKHLLRTGENTLLIVFHSAVRIGLEKLAALGYPLPAANDLSELGGLGGQKVSVFSRKPGYHFGWDWGPRFVTCGIWRPVRLDAWDTARIRYVHYKLQELTGEQAFYKAELEIEAAAGCSVQATITSSSDLSIKAETDITLHKGNNRATIDFTIPNPRLWWCNGAGAAVLYNLTARLMADKELAACSETRIGVRNVRIVQKADTKGRSFYVELNGIPVFMKGANYIPNDNFLPRVTADDYAKITGAARDANMNMLRVWGGGFYEQDLFYNLCDEQGILVWQDFMFGCAMYPGDKLFLDTVKEEAVQNVKRLRNHPCIALWCGNNEIHSAWAPGAENTGWFWKKQYTHNQQDTIWKAYDKLFHHMLPEVIAEHTHRGFYWPSSPMAADGKLAAYDTPSGDIHYWGVWHGKHPFSEFHNYIGRFVSEYGFQSFPCLKTIKTFTIPEDRDIESPVMQSHQRSGNGNALILEYMANYYKLPGDFESFLYVSQLLQAEAVQTAIDAHRRNMPYCMGSLYWQLNDCWPVVSWSGIDYCKRWKALHYYVRSAFKPVVLIPYLHEHKLDLFVVSDHLTGFDGALKLELLDFRGNVLLEKTHNIAADANAGTLVYSTDPDALLAGENPGTVFLSAALWENNRQIARRLVYFAPFKDIDFPYAALQKQVFPGSKGAKVRLTCDVLAKNIFLDTENAGGFFTDNFIDLVPGETAEVEFIASDSATLREEDLKVLVLNNIYGKQGEGR